MATTTHSTLLQISFPSQHSGGWNDEDCHLTPTIKMPELFEDYENLFNATIDDDELARGYMCAANKKSMMKYRQNSEGSKYYGRPKFICLAHRASTS